MNWEAIGAIGEIGGFIAVLMTLLFLSAQIRHIVKQNRAAAWDSGTRAAQLMLIQTATNSDLVALLIKASGKPSELSAEQILQFRSYVSYWTLTYQQVFIERGQNSEEWESSKLAIRAFCQTPLYWKTIIEISAAFDRRFHTELKTIQADSIAE